MVRVPDSALVEHFRTLIVDDDADAARTMAAALENLLGPVEVVPDTYQALSRHGDDPFDLVIVEVALPGASGIDLLERLNPLVPAVVVTWLVSPAVAARAVKAGAHAVLTKPCDIANLVTAALSAAASRGPAQYVAV